MQEFEVGKTYILRGANGTTQVLKFLGGDPKSHASWQALSDEPQQSAPAPEPGVPGAQMSPRWLGPLSDEAEGLGAGVRALLKGQPFGDAYHEAAASSQGRQAELLAADPIQQRVKEAIPMLAAPGAAAAKRIGGSVLSRLLAGAAAGGAEGAAYGVAEAEGSLEERAKDPATLLSTTIGVVTGGAGATAVPGLNRLGRPAASRGKRIARALFGETTDARQGVIASGLRNEDEDVIQQILDPSPEMRERLKAMIPDPIEFRMFERQVIAERSAEKAASALRRWLPRLGAVVGTGAAGAGAVGAYKWLFDEP